MIGYITVFSLLEDHLHHFASYTLMELQQQFSPAILIFYFFNLVSTKSQMSQSTFCSQFTHYSAYVHLLLLPVDDQMTLM